MTQSGSGPPPLNPEYLRALGLVAVLYNRLEQHFLVIHTLLMGAPHKIVWSVFANSTNATRVRLFNQMIDLKTDLPAEYRDRFRHFARGFAVCAENRNLLMHSGLLEPESSENYVTLLKATRDAPTAFNRYVMPITTIVAVAKEIDAFNYFGSWTSACYCAVGRPDFAQWTLPDIPVLPTNLAAAYRTDRSEDQPPH